MKRTVKHGVLRRAARLFLVLALALALFGCGKEGADDVTATEQKAAETTTEPAATEPVTAEPVTAEPVTQEPETDPKTPPEPVENSALTWEDFTFTLNGKTYASRLTPDDFAAADGWIENTEINYGQTYYPRDHLLPPGEGGYLVFTRADADLTVMLYYENIYEDETRLIRCPCYSANFYGTDASGLRFARDVGFGASEEELTAAFGTPDESQDLSTSQPVKILLYKYGICALVFVVQNNALITAQFVYG